MSYKKGDKVLYVHSDDMKYVDRYRDADGNPAVVEVNGDDDYFIYGTVLTGPHKGANGTWTDSEVEPAMKVLSIKRSKQNDGSVKIYGEIRGESGKTYQFAYIRRENFRGWICACTSFMLTKQPKKRNCKHLHFIRATYGRFGSKVPKS